MPCTRADCTKHRQLTKSDKVSVITMPSSSSWRKWGARCYTAVQCAYTCRIVVFSGQLDKPHMPCMGADCTKHRQLWSLVVSWISQGLLNLKLSSPLIIWSKYSKLLFPEHQSIFDTSSSSWWTCCALKYFSWLWRCWEMSTLPAGYIPQRKVTLASSSGLLGFIVCEVL